MRLMVWLTLVAWPIQAHAGVVGTDDRQTMADYAIHQKQAIAAVRQQFQASGRIMCPFGEASAFLADRNNIVVTARHVLFPEKQMHAYAGKGSINRCGFELTDGTQSTWYKVDVKSFVYPDDKQRSIFDRFDWVVMKLEVPIQGVTPYHLANQPPSVGDSVELVTIRQNDFPQDGWNERLVADCKIRAVEAIDDKSASGLQTDCSASGGASGGALVKRGSDGWDVVGIMSSSTPSCPRFDAHSCFTFDVGVYDDVKEAVHSLSGSK